MFMDWWIEALSAVMGALTISLCEERADSKSKAVNVSMSMEQLSLSVSWEMHNVWKNKVLDTLSNL